MIPANHYTLSHRRLSYFAPFTVVFITVLLVGFLSARLYCYVKTPNVDLKGKRHMYLYIPTGTDFGGLLKIFKEKDMLMNERSFIYISQRKHYDSRVKPGRYKIQSGMNNNELVNLLRSGRQEPVKLNIQSARTIAELAGRLSHQVEADSSSLMKFFLDPASLKPYGIDTYNVFVLFIPNTYEMFWNTSAMQLLNKMSLEQTIFWNPGRRRLLSSTGMSIEQVVTLASIVEKETNKDQEKPDIAGVYINRLKKKWPLQADPTIIFAWQDYSIRRVTARHLKIDSKYNTYTHTGLPPGPVCIPSISSIDAVLNFRHHGYMYFCAKEDLSGSHNFAASLAEHNKNAKKYQQALDRLNIR